MSLITQLSYLSLAYWCLRAYYSVVHRVYGVFFAAERPLELRQFGDWCVVTGSAQGLSRAFAESFARRKFSVVLIGPQAEPLRNFAADLEDDYGVLTKVIELEGRDDWSCEKIEEELAELDIGVLVNNFCVNYAHPEFFLEVTRGERVFADVVWWNVVLTVELCRIVMPQMVERGGGVVINVSSTFAVVPSPLLTVFAASKAFALKFSKDLSAEYRARGIIVQCLCPGSISTEDPRWTSPTPKVYVESALRTVGRDPVTTGFFPHTLVIGLMRLIHRLSPDTLVHWMTTIMQRNRRRELRKSVE